jgi:two-component system response regulator FlrC
MDDVAVTVMLWFQSAFSSGQGDGVMNKPVSQVLKTGLIAEDKRSRELLTLSQRVAASDVTVMISGDSGTGKEVLARFIHAHSERAAGPFVAINCAAIPENMLEAVLFGHERGAFTGAYKSSPGKFEQAQGGTLLLDEITEMELGLQAKLLRVLQEREVERLGGNDSIPLDLRVLATTNRNMREAVSNGRFRQDLYYRLNVFPLNIPALRDRPEDVVPLAQQLACRHEKGDVYPGFSREAEQYLRSHAWPGNVRELENVVQRALILKTGHRIEVSDICLDEVVDLPAPVAQEYTTGTGSEMDTGRVLEKDLKMKERELIIAALEAGNGSRKDVAHRLGISPRTLRYKLARLRDAGMEISRTAGMKNA